MNVSDASKKLLDALKEAKEKSKATYEDLALRAGCNSDTIKNIFGGKTSCANFLTVCEICRELGVSVDEIADIPLRVDKRSHVDNRAFTATLDALNAGETRTDVAHRETIQLLQGSIANYRTALTDARARWEEREKKLNAKNLRLAIALYAILFVLIMIMLVDFITPTAGWWRGRLAEAATQVLRAIRQGRAIG